MDKHRRVFLKHTLLGAAAVGLSSNAVSAALSVDRKAQQYSDDLMVFNTGVGGNNSVDLLKRVDKDCISLKPRLTILMVGTNDMNSVKHVPIEQYESNLASLIRRIKDSGSKVLLMTIIPAYAPDLLTRHPAAFYHPEGVAGRRAQVNDVIKKLSEKHRTEFLDLGHRFQAIGNIGTDRDSLIQNEANSNKRDGIHPTANGYRFIALAVYDYLTARKLTSGNIVCFGDSITKGDGSMDRNSYPAYLKKLLKPA